MKLKLMLFIMACAISVTIAYADCELHCSGGSMKCCAEGSYTFYGPAVDVEN